MNSTAVSIILPVYNVSQYLDRCFTSIVAQTFSEFEVIVINDGSTDDSGTVCDKWEAYDSRISVTHIANGGVANARNIGISKAKGSYIYFIDPDDWIEDNLIEDNYKIAIENDADIVIFGFHKEQLINGKPVTISMAPPKMTMSGQPEIADNLVKLLSKTNGFSVWTKFIKADLIADHQLRFPLMKRGQDMAFSLELYRNSKSIVVTDKCYYHYNAFTSASKFDAAIFENHMLLYNRLCSLFENWMEKKANFRYAIKLFLVWFGYVVPANIVGAEKLSRAEKFSQIKTMISHPDFKRYMELFKDEENLSMQSKLYLKVLNSRSPWLVYFTTSIARIINTRSRTNFKKVF